MPDTRVTLRTGIQSRPVLLSLLVLCGLATSSVSAQTRERAIYVSAVDAKGAPVESLAPADVGVREDGIAREVLRITPATDAMQIAVLADNSAASSAHIMDLRKALKAFVAAIPAPHEIALVTYGDRPTIATDYTSSRDAVERGIDRLFAQSSAGSYLLDAIAEASRGMQKREATRPVIVAVSMEGVEFSNLTYEPVLDRLKGAGASLYVMTITQAGGSAAGMRNDEIRNREIVYDRGTRESGGRREILLSSMALEDALQALAKELLHQYKVVYARPTTLIPPEKVTIESKREALTVRGVPARPEKGEPR